VLGVVLTSFIIIYMNQQIENPFFPNETVIKSSFVRILDVNKNDLFSLMMDVQNYPTILPENVLSIKIINQTSNTIFAEEEFVEKGIKVKLLVKHTIQPYESHMIEVLSGDAQNSIITQKFESFDSKTKITTEIELHLKGVLIPFSFIADQNIEHASSTVINKFEQYLSQ